MRYPSVLLLALLIVNVSSTRAQAAAANQHHLMPVPASIHFEAGRLPLDPAFGVSVAGHRDERLLRGIERAMQKLRARTGLELPREIASGTSGKFVLDVNGAGEAVQSIAEDESYTLQVTSQGVSLKAATVVGALRGLETLLQLVEGDSGGYYLPAVEIADRPRFPWRGLLIDVCRHWEPVEVIERNLDAMAAVKLNVFHWHLSEDQGIRVESRRFPKLHQLGSDGLYYTQKQIREVVNYARDRGIRVVPEFDMPGHSTAWFVGYPEYSSGPGPYAIERAFGVFDPTFDPTREEVYKFIDGFIAEMAALFPDAYWHIGGDENNGKQWDANPAIRLFKERRGLKDNAALQAYFNQRVSRILEKHGKKMVGWDEIMHPDLPRNVVVQSWRGEESLASGAKQGFQGILSAGYYLDGMVPAASHYTVDPLPATSDLDASQAARILGGEACMWGELITPENIDSRIWPRTAAIAERFWSPRDVADASDMYRRVAAVSVQLEAAGALHISGPDAMLRRLADTNAIGPLRTLLGVVEPLSLGKRMSARRATQLTPLATLGDIAIADPSAKQQIATWVDGVLHDPQRRPAYREKLEKEFRKWRELRAALLALAADAPLVRDADAAAANLAELGATGEEALGYLAHGVKVPKDWTDAKLALLERAAKAQGLLRIAVIPSMKALITAVAQ